MNGDELARLAVLEVEMKACKKLAENNGKDIRKLLALANKQAGGWQAVLIVAGIAGTFGAIFTKLAGLFWIK